MPDSERVQDQVLREVAILRGHLYRDPEAYVRKWSQVQCSDYQVPLIRLIAFLSDSLQALRIRSDPESSAILDIIHQTCLTRMIEYDLVNHCVQFRKGVTENDKTAISGYLDSVASILTDKMT